MTILEHDRAFKIQGPPGSSGRNKPIEISYPIEREPSKQGEGQEVRENLIAKTELN